MNMANVSLFGWIHTLASVLALAAGAFVLFRAKGTRLHRLFGKIYAGALLVAGFTVFRIYHFDIQFVPFKAGPDIFGLFHWQTVVTLVVLLLALFSARRQRQAFFAYAHPIAMLVTYYMVIAALVNELFVRVTPLRLFAEGQLQGAAANPAQAPIARIVQMGARIGFLLLLVWFVAKVVRQRGARARGASLRPAAAP
jgi:uncharacterized membrane protein